MTENEKTVDEDQKTSEEQGVKAKFLRRKSKKPRQQSPQSSLGISTEKVEEIQKKLFIARFIDYLSEDTLDFIYKDKATDHYVKDMNTKLASLDKENEEDKLLKMSFEDKKIIETIYNVKANAESVAQAKGITRSTDSKYKRVLLVTSIPLFAVALIITFLNIESSLIFLFIIMCIYCMVPQFLKSYLLKKWFAFKEENKNEIYTQNREDIMVLKSFVGEILNNIRAKLLQDNVPLDKIQFVLHSRDYENLKLITQRDLRGTTQYFFNFEYPEGMEPITEKLEKNFIVLTELKAKDGIIESFVPTLRKDLAEKINQILNESEFSESPKEFKEIIPTYSERMAVYCICGEIVEFTEVQVVNWQDQFKFYLFEGKECKCGEKVYAISLMDDSTKAPEELKEIFLS
jgi:hypothetical protein